MLVELISISSNLSWWSSKSVELADSLRDNEVPGPLSGPKSKAVVAVVYIKSPAGR